MKYKNVFDPPKFCVLVLKSMETNKMKIKKQFGTWDSIISSTDASSQKRLANIKYTENGTLLWCEGRGPIYVIVAQKPGEAANDISTGIAVQGGVGYGGGEFDVFENIVAFAGADGRIYVVEIDHGKPKAITPSFGGVASPTFSPNGETLAFVHSYEDKDVLATVPSDGSQWPRIHAQGADFYMQPTWTQDGKSIVYVCWDHPNMPWDFSRVEATDFFGNKEIIFNENASLQPSYSPDSKHLAFLSDAEATSKNPEAGGKWQLFVKNKDGEIRQITNEDIDFGGPAWIQGLRFYEWIDNNTLILLGTHSGIWSAFIVNITTCSLKKIIELENYQLLAQPTVDRKNKKVSFIASSPQIPTRLISFSLHEKITSIIMRTTAERIAPETFSPMLPKSWKSKDIQIFGNYYPPINNKFESGGLPPAIIMIHGGPTSQRSAAFDLRNQFFATRGYAVMDVNYRGSTGYGRNYKRALYGNWGIADVEDATSAAHYLADQKLADPNKIIIMGGSAGGYTVLQSLAISPDTFAAGICSYGISNLFTLASSTHKFEASYNDLLLGPLPESAEIFRERSPIFYPEKIKSPLAIFHGRQDKAVPFDQAESLVSMLGSPHVFHAYDNEGHGWRHPETIEHFYKNTLLFLEEFVLFA